ncbi:MAG TPA: YggT family protein [Thermoleophilaceae bacterium]|jgi:YggT family protein
MIVPLAIDRVDIANYLDTLIVVYFVLIFVRILMSWLPTLPYSRWLDIVLGFVRDVTDPYLNLFRRFVPSIRVGGGGIDLSPMVAILVLFLVGGLVVRAVHG